MVRRRLVAARPIVAVVDQQNVAVRQLAHRVGLVEPRGVVLKLKVGRIEARRERPEQRGVSVPAQRDDRVQVAQGDELDARDARWAEEQTGAWRDGRVNR